MVNVACSTQHDLRAYTAFGKLIGVAIRSKTLLDLDMASVFWKALVEGLPGFDVDYDNTVEMGLSESNQAGKDLLSFDYNTWKFLQFKFVSFRVLFYMFS
jgi:hypothetical protein